MRLECVEQRADVVFKISEYDKKFIPVFQAAYYEKGAGYYYKTFPKDAKCLNWAQEKRV